MILFHICHRFIQLMVVDQNGFEKTNTTVKLRLTLSSDTVSSEPVPRSPTIVTNDWVLYR